MFVVEAFDQSGNDRQHQDGGGGDEQLPDRCARDQEATSKIFPVS